MEVERLSNGTFKHIEGELYHYHETKRERNQLRQDILHSTIRFSSPSVRKDPTGEQVLLLQDRRIQHLETVIDAIESVYDDLPEIKKKLVHFLYWNQPRQYTWEGIASHLYISKRTAQRWRKSIVEEIASKLGWR